MELSRRDFLKGAGVGVAGTTLGAFGFGDIEAAYAAAIRPFKLASTTETRNTCPYCSVACGIIMYSKGDLKKGEKAEITHIEGDADHPDQPRHALPEGRGAARLRPRGDAARQYPMIRKPGSDKFERVSWDDGARPHRAPDEGRPRQELHRQEQRRRHRQPVDDDRLPRRVGHHQRNGVR